MAHHMMERLGVVWRDKIRSDYEQGLFPYERSLQAAFYHHLRNELGPERVYAEAIQKLSEIENRVPDLILCTQEHVDVWLEIKYCPWWPLTVQQYGGDLEKLVQLAESDSEKACCKPNADQSENR